MKIALALIVKGTDDEALCLDKCLTNLEPHVDGIFVTSTYKKGDKPNEMVAKIARVHNAVVSEYEWTNDFASARNFNFSQVPKEYDYILWCDADDIWENAGLWRETIEKHPVDAYLTWYCYEFDEYNQPTVVHKKINMLKNDGSFSWVGRIHEDIHNDRSIDIQFVDGIKRIHQTNGERITNARKRNLEIAQLENEKKPEDPHTFWNLANAYIADGQPQKATDAFHVFIGLTGSEEEKYLAYCRLALCYHDMNNRTDAIRNFQLAIGMKPHFPDAYFQLATLLFEYGDYNRSVEYGLQGLVKKPPYHELIVYNPRDYDYNPMMLLSKAYFQMNRPDLALSLMKGCLKIYPQHTYLKPLVAELEYETERMNKVIPKANELEKITDDAELLKQIKALPLDEQSHPAITRIKNQRFIKKTSSGKDIVYYCGFNTHEWNPLLFKSKGYGGSEEAVVNLAREWVKKGWNVTVYNNCGPAEMKVDGVVYKPFWMWNYRDRQDVVVLWRSPKPLDFNINAKKIYVDLHDVIPPAEFLPARLEKVEKVFVKTQFHRSLFPNIPDEKIAVIPNGIDLSMFKGNEKRDPYLLINTSSPDRSMDVVPKLFKEVKKRVPKAKMKWAYGWEIFNNTFATDSPKLAWRDKIQAEIDEAGIESLGKLPQSECAKLYMQARILAYPTEFAEIDCISVKKAQLAGCLPATTDFGALAESVKYGVKVHSDKTAKTWCRDFQDSFGLEDPAKQQEWIDAVVKELESPMVENKEMKEWAKGFSWDLIADKWIKEYEY